MRLLIAADSIITLDMLLTEIATRSWPSGTQAQVLSVIEDADVPSEIRRAEGYGVAAVRHECEEEENRLRLWPSPVWERSAFLPRSL